MLSLLVDATWAFLQYYSSISESQKSYSLNKHLLLKKQKKVTRCEQEWTRFCVWGLRKKFAWRWRERNGGCLGTPMTHNKKNEKWGPQNSCIHANEGPTMSQGHSFMFLLFVFVFVFVFLLIIFLHFLLQYERNRCSTEFRSDSNFLFFYISLLSACKLTPHPSFCTTKFIISHYSLSLSRDCFIYN